MTCPNCNHKNTNIAKFCTECGSSLKSKHSKTSKVTPPTQSTSSGTNKDTPAVIFVIVVVVAVFISLIFFINKLIISRNSEKYAIKAEPVAQVQPTPTIEPTPTPTPKPTTEPTAEPTTVPAPQGSSPQSSGGFPVENLQITSIEPVWTGSYDNPIPFLNVSVNNSSDRAATAVQLKVDFYSSQSADALYDTKYVVLLGVANPGGSVLRGNIPGFKLVGDDTWYDAYIISAKYN